MTLWGGRFDASPDDVAWSYTAATTDRRLLVEDIEGSIVHAKMLHRVGLLDDGEHQAVQEGLSTVLGEARQASFSFAVTDEDVHTAVERRLVELVGDAGKKLHTGRSRNDQIALDVRLYMRRAALERIGQLTEFCRTLASLALEHSTVVVPSYTHLQQAQAVPLGHHLLAYAWMAYRDRERFTDLGRRLQTSPLGAGASGGSSLPLDPGFVAEELGFGASFANSMDAVGARDLVAEYIWCCSQTMVDLSRLSEELVLWSSSEFGWVTFSEGFTTGSSALPQKKNPDVAELARGKAAGAIGSLTSILALQKALPLTYNRDLQEDKEHLFAADDVTAATLKALTPMLTAASFHPPAPTAWVTALDLAEVLVKRGVPFREAHHAVGRLVAGLLEGGQDLSGATAKDLAAAHSRFEPSDLELIDPAGSVRRRISPGGGSVEAVEAQVSLLEELL